jgi:hypothetical protein
MNDEQLIWETYKNRILLENSKLNLIIDPEVRSYAESKGYTIEAYHGSKEKELTEISISQTSYGLFFSPDIQTTKGYTGDDGKSYHVLIYAPEDKILDLTDDLTRYNFFNEHFSSGNIKYADRNSNEELSHKDMRNVIINSLKTNPEIVKFLNSKYPPEEDETEEEMYENLEYVIEENLYDLIEEPIISKLFEDDYYKVDEDVLAILNAYGSQDFYWNYQNSVLKTANQLGYLMVVFDDAATLMGGESTSYVVFNPKNIKLADKETYDNNGNVIPLEKRFNRNISDIRY